MLKEKKLKNPNPNPHRRNIVQPVRLNTNELNEIMTKAHLYTEGNIGKFLRIAAINYKPLKKELK